MLTHLRNFFADWLESFKTYYLSYMVAFSAAVLWILIIYYGEDRGVLYELLATCGITFPLFLLAPLSLQVSKKKNTIFLIVGSLLTTIISFLFALYVGHYHVFDYPSLETYAIITMLSYLIAWTSVFGVIASVFPRDNLSLRGWGKELLSHACIAGLGSLILRGGISASLGSIDYLFDISIAYKRYMYVGIVSFLIIGVSIFLTRLHKTDAKFVYENILRFFGLYIFFPLAIIYALILLAYGLKIVTTGQWPKGLISMMVVGYTLRGLVSYLFTYPLETLSVWKKRMQDSYFVSILVFVFLLLGAIGVRVAQYGITEHRYLILMIGVWILVVGSTSLIWPKKALRTMIFTLIGLSISSAYFPRGAGTTALDSQKAHFVSLAKKNGLYEDKGMYADNSMIWKETSVDGMDKDQLASLSRLASIGSYIEQYYGIEELRALYGEGTGRDILQKPDGYYGIDRENIFLSLGLTGDFSQLYQYNDGNIDPEETTYYSFYGDDQQQILDIQQYSYLITLSVGEYMEKYNNSDTNPMTSKDGNLKLYFSGTNNTLITLYQSGQKDIILDLNDLAQELYTQSLQNNNKTYRKDFDSYSLIINNASGQKGKENIVIESASLLLLIK